MLHEIGHALGLEHSNESGSIMSAWYTGSEVLGETDIQAIQSLYGKPGTPFPNAEDENTEGRPKIPPTEQTPDTETWPSMKNIFLGKSFIQY